MPCDKRGYSNIENARSAHRQAGYRLRVYRCEECGQLHTTNAEKRAGHTKVHEVRDLRNSSTPLGLAPRRTLEELQEIARRKRAAAGY